MLGQAREATLSNRRLARACGQRGRVIGTATPDLSLGSVPLTLGLPPEGPGDFRIALAPPAQRSIDPSPNLGESPQSVYTPFSPCLRLGVLSMELDSMIRPASNH